MGPVSCRRGNPKLSDGLSPLHHSDTAKTSMETEPSRAVWCHQAHPRCSAEQGCIPEPTGKVDMESCSHHPSMGAPCSRSAEECQSLRWINRTDYTTSCVICTAVVIIMHSAEASGFPVK